MTNFKKQLESIKQTVEKPTDFIRQLVVADAVSNCELLTTYETLIKRPIKDNEFNQLCNFVFDFGSNLDASLITYNLFRLLTENEDWDEATSTRNAKFKLSDLKDENKSNEIYDQIIDIIRDYSDDMDYFI